MQVQGLAPHEIIELHEILMFKNVCLTKSTTMSPLVSDNELKSILQQDIVTTQKHIEELRELMQSSNIASTNTTDINTASYTLS